MEQRSYLVHAYKGYFVGSFCADTGDGLHVGIAQICTVRPNSSSDAQPLEQVRSVGAYPDREKALTAAQHQFGLDKVARIAVAGGTDATVCTPCGGCRQAILEAAQLSGREIEIICGSGDGSGVERHRIGELIPFGFGPVNLTA